MITPRASEVSAALEVLESDEYDTSKDMAKAIVKAVADALAKRQTYAIVPAGLTFGYGPFWSTAEAEKAWTKEIGSSFDAQASLVPVHPWSPPEHHTAGVCACGHGPHNHVVRNVRGGKTSSPAECGISKCGCQNFTERKKAA